MGLSNSDTEGAIYDAIHGTGYGLTVLPFYDGYWGGVWSGASYSSGTGLTTFTGNFGTRVGGGALGDSVKPGMVVVPDLHRAVPLHIESVNINLLGSDTLTVKGDATGLGGSGTRFRIHQHAPYKYDLTDEVKRNNPCDLGARYLWSSYRRIPWTWSRAGEDPYLAWNRVYLPEIGRWTSADALYDDLNLSAYCFAHPIATSDPSGLATLGIAWTDLAEDRDFGGTETLAHAYSYLGLSVDKPGCKPSLHKSHDAGGAISLGGIFIGEVDVPLVNLNPQEDAYLTFTVASQAGPCMHIVNVALVMDDGDYTWSQEVNDGDPVNPTLRSINQMYMNAVDYVFQMGAIYAAGELQGKVGDYQAGATATLQKDLLIDWAKSAFKDTGVTGVISYWRVCGTDVDGCGCEIDLKTWDDGWVGNNDHRIQRGTAYASSAGFGRNRRGPSTVLSGHTVSRSGSSWRD